MRQKIVAGNWKMHGGLQQNAALIADIRSGAADLACEVVVCPPFPYLAQVVALLADGRIDVGAQTLNECPQGAYTGEVSGAMLAEIGCRYVLVGHSERRALFGESDQQVAAKFEAAQLAGLTPVLCVGETLVEREAGVTEAVVSRQLAAVLDRVGVEALGKAVLAYEPVWAIGTGKTASPALAQEVHRAMREFVAQRNAGVAKAVRIVYGGSVKPDNARDLFEQADIDGGLVGGAALVAADFLAICRAAV